MPKLIKNFIRKDSIDSTSNLAKKISQSSPEGTVVIAREQTSGRGKPGSNWYSPCDLGLYFSIILKPYKNPKDLSSFTLLAAQAVKKVLDQYLKEVSIKLPNDLLVKDKKICGILTEKVKESLILGIGLNVNNGDFPEELKDRSTSFYLENNRQYDLEDLFQEMLLSIEEVYFKFLKSKL